MNCVDFSFLINTEQGARVAHYSYILEMLQIQTGVNFKREIPSPYFNIVRPPTRFHCFLCSTHVPNNTPSRHQRVGRVSEFTDEMRFDFTRVILDDDIHGGDKVLLVIIFGESLRTQGYDEVISNDNTLLWMIIWWKASNLVILKYRIMGFTIDNNECYQTAIY